MSVAKLEGRRWIPVSAFGAEVRNLIADVSDDETLHAMVRVAAKAQTVEQLQQGLREARAGT